jgi:hypothetical protein
VCCCCSPAAPESGLLLLLQDKLSLLRLPTDLMDSKLACANSLALLNPTWMADLQVGLGFGSQGVADVVHL